MKRKLSITFLNEVLNCAKASLRNEKESLKKLKSYQVERNQNHFICKIQFIKLFYFRVL